MLSHFVTLPFHAFSESGESGREHGLPLTEGVSCPCARYGNAAGRVEISSNSVDMIKPNNRGWRLNPQKHIASTSLNPAANKAQSPCKQEQFAFWHLFHNTPSPISSYFHLIISMRVSVPLSIAIATLFMFIFVICKTYIVSHSIMRFGYWNNSTFICLFAMDNHFAIF